MKSHRDLIAWQKGRALAIRVHRYCLAAWSPEHSATLGQLRRAALSVPLNIAEGYASGPGPRCRFHLRIAYGSAIETTEILSFQLELVGARGNSLEELQSASKEVEAILFRLWQRSRSKPL